MTIRLGRATGPLLVLLAVLLSVLGLGGLTGPAGAQQPSDGQAPAGVGAHTWTVEPITFELMTGPDSALPVTIDADLWKPDAASAGEPMPAIVHQHGFGGHKANAESLTNAAYFASHGYVVVSVTTQGFGASTGCLALDRLDYDGSNTMGVIDWLAEQDYVAVDAPGDPQVGLLGGSYGGGHQGLVAVADPRVDAIVPGRTWHSLSYSLVPNNWADAADPWDLDHYEQGVFKQEWTSLFFALGQAQPARGNGGCDPITRQTRYPTAPPCNAFIPGTCEIYGQLVTTGDADQAGRDLVAGSALATGLDELTTPTLLPQGLPDTLFNPNETVPTLLSLQERGVPVAAIWHSSGHGGYQGAPGDGEAYTGRWDDSPEAQAEFARTYLPRRTLSWMERHVRGRDDVDTGPTFAWFRPWVEYDVAQTGGTSAPAYGTSDTYPAAQATELAFTLDPADGSLAAPGTAISGGTASFLNPLGGQPAAYSETSNYSSPGQPGDRPAQEQPGQFVSFTTAAFDAPVEVAGVPELRVHLSHQNVLTDAVLFAKLYDVAPDGSATLIRRMVAPARVPTAALDAGPVDLHLVGTSWRFEAGHAARLVLASTDLAYFNNRAPDQLTVSSTAEAPSTLTLPVIASQDRAGTPEPTPAPEPTQPAMPATGGGLVVLALGALLVGGGVRRSRG